MQDLIGVGFKTWSVGIALFLPSSGYSPSLPKFRDTVRKLLKNFQKIKQNFEKLLENFEIFNDIF